MDSYTPNLQNVNTDKGWEFHGVSTGEIHIHIGNPGFRLESENESEKPSQDVLEINLGNHPSLSHRSIDSKFLLRDSLTEEVRTKINKVPDLFRNKQKQPLSHRSSASAAHSKASSKLPDIDLVRSQDIEDAPPTERADLSQLAPFIPMYVLEGLEDQAGIDSIDENDLSTKLKLLRKETVNQDKQKEKARVMIEELKQEKLELNVKISRVQRDHMEHKQILLSEINSLKERLQELNTNVRDMQDLDDLNNQITHKENSILHKQETILQLKAKIQQTNSEYLSIKLKEKKTLEEVSRAEDQMRILLNELNSFERKQIQERTYHDTELSKLSKQLDFYKSQIPLLTSQKNSLEEDNANLTLLLKSKQRGKHSEAIQQKEAELQETKKAIQEAEASSQMKVEEFERLLQSLSPIKTIVDFK